jgi:hypothetical protein
MKKNTLAKSLVVSLAAVTIMGFMGCDSSQMTKKKPMPQKQQKMSEPASNYHPSENKTKYPAGQGEPKVAPNNTQKSQDFNSTSQPRPQQQQQQQQPAQQQSQQTNKNM